MIIRLSTTRQHGSNLHTINFQNNFPKFNLPGIEKDTWWHLFNPNLRRTCKKPILRE
ncbi:hypothetical protein ES319_D07G053000v1 [Gossypium barbadense]|uniref:Uncharacterized protein n=1 Tax=Gossypium barbadense TaxID=3634 RepID=A0A5J5QMA5_GOSBA|nr:hypothetical protein ES319_D07G053000v1 [Gossypium barbadense]